jgi:hypothetical protein
MDVLVLIDKLDDLVHNAKAVPLTDQVRIDRDEIYDILDQMRATIPEELKQARWIGMERQTRLEMEDWADGILSTLEVNLDKFLVAVRRGRERLHERSQETVVAGIGPADVNGDEGY